MDSARWEKVQSLFHQAVELPEGEQRDFLNAQCAGDTALACEVLALLGEDSVGDSLLDRDVAEAAHQIFQDPAAKSPPFEEFGPYRIVRPLGEGGMGVVYLAEREDLGSQVAIKILRDAWLSPARRERFSTEQRTLAQLNHPSIARLYDASTSPDGTPFFVMEFVEGVPITDYCRRHRVTVKERLRIFRAVGDAVLYAHQQAVIHRDLKPSNIFVKDDGTVRLLDFGIAKRVESLRPGIDQTVAGLRMMTPAYAAPEQIRGEQVGIQADVYSLGVVLYELLAGHHPFDLAGCTPIQAEKILTEQEAKRPSSVPGQLGAAEESIDPPEDDEDWSDLDVLCLTAMHRDRGQRYQSAEALLRDIDHYLKDEPLDARPDTLRYRLGKFATRNRRSLVVAAVAFVVIAALATFFAVRLERARVASVAEAARTQRIQKFMTNLFQGGDASAGPSDDLRVVTLLDRGAQEAQSLNAEPAVQAELYQTVGTLYQNLGKLDQANAMLTSALKLRQSLYGPDNAEVAEILVALGSLRADQGQLPEAETLVRQGLDMSRRHLPSDHPAVAKATTALGNVLAERGSYDEAIQTLNEAIRLQPESATPTPELMEALYALADAQFEASHYDISESLNQRLLPMYRQTYGDRHPRVADALINLGAIQNDLGHYPEAEKFERQALDIVQGWYGKEGPETATDLTILARTLVYENRFNEGIALLQQSLAIKERSFGPVHPSVASTLNDLGNAASHQEKFDLAEQYFRREVEIYRSVYGEHHYLLATALSNLGSVYSGRHQWKQAEEIFRTVIPIYVEAQSAHNINTGIARIKLGKTLLRQDRYAEAEAQSRAGYDILISQMDPNVSWLVNARKDLVEEYSALKQPDQAAKFRQEMAGAKAHPSASHQ